MWLELRGLILHRNELTSITESSTRIDQWTFTITYWNTLSFMSLLSQNFLLSKKLKNVLVLPKIISLQFPYSIFVFHTYCISRRSNSHWIFCKCIEAKELWNLHSIHYTIFAVVKNYDVSFFNKGKWIWHFKEKGIRQSQTVSLVTFSWAENTSKIILFTLKYLWGNRRCSNFK